jgi:hypothetical protein
MSLALARGYPHQIYIVYSVPFEEVLYIAKVAEFYKMSSSLTLYFHTPKINFLPLFLAKCSYSKKIEAGNLI